MRIAVFGAGAVGGHIAARLALGGTPVAVIARGAHLQAIRARGLVLRVGAETFTVNPRATDQPADLGPQDIVVVSVKAPSLPSVTDTITPLIGPHTRIAFAMNGLPWWFLDGLKVKETPELKRHLDPTGRMDAVFTRARAAACVVTSGGRMIEPGVIENTTPKINILTLGFSDGRGDPVIAQFVERAIEGGYKASLTDRIREAIWAKLFINAAAGVVAALTYRSTSETVSDPELHALVAACIREIIEIGHAIGVEVNADPIGMADVLKSHHHRASILQDLEAGRPLEISTTVIATRELARIAGVSAPHLTTIAALIGARAADVMKPPATPQDTRWPIDVEGN